MSGHLLWLLLASMAAVTLGAPVAAAHTEPCYVSVFPLGWDASGCRHNVGEEVYHQTDVQCDWIYDQPLIRRGCPIHILPP